MKKYILTILIAVMALCFTACGSDSSDGSGDAAADGSTLIYDIRDDGIGVDEDRIQAILSNQIIKENSLEGFALSNIQSRIRLQYGNDYGIQYFNRPGGGSKVIVTQPYEE